MLQPIPHIMSGVALLATLSLACSSSSDPSRPEGMTGSWLVTPGVMDETAAGRGSCTVAPFTMTIDSTAALISATLPTVLNLQCTDSIYGLDPSPMISWLNFSPTDSQHFAVFGLAGSPNDEIVGFAWPDISGDSIGGVQIDLDQANLVNRGLSTWKGIRQ